MSQPPTGDIAVIGAGLAGAACARALVDAGRAPVLFDKGRGPGGRLSTRRTQTPLGALAIDHGAQFVTARTAPFLGFLKEAEAAGLAAVWSARIVSIDRGGNAVDLRPEDRWVGTPGMNGLVKAALHGLSVEFGRRAARLKGKAGQWQVCFEDGTREGPFRQIALTLPPEQLIDLLARSDGDFPDLITEARRAVIGPCQAVMAALDGPFDPGFEGAKLLGGGLRWMARTNSRPGRSGPESWVLHASPDWSRAHLDADPDAVARQLCEEAYVRFNMPQPVWRQAHRWLYALSEVAPGTPAALDETGTVGCGGDWRLGARAELAWQSGMALGAQLAARG